MILKNLHSRWLGLLGAAALCSAGCTGDTGVAADGDTDAADTDDSNGPGDSQTSTTGTEPDTTTGGPGDETDGGNFIDPATEDDGPGNPLPNGAECSSPADCESGFCYTVPGIGGACSECVSDSDCDNTCSFDFGVGYAVCTDGSLGKMCDSTDGCQDDLECATIFDAGFFQASFCSECSDDSHCDGDDICSPHYDLDALSGHMYCAEPGSVPNDQGCPIENGQGNGEVCENGHCGVANVGGFIDVGVCGSCSTDDDCENEETCTPASAGEDGLQGAYCG